MYEPITKCSYFNVLTEITEFLGCNLLIKKQISTGYRYYTLTAFSHLSLTKILTYFNSEHLNNLIN